ncbi:MAG: hypothetical protein IT179_20520 [Acidobacteria bacterium]|nr:hypothetical protein [Acidobacteriota bacterium]
MGFVDSRAQPATSDPQLLPDGQNSQSSSMPIRRMGRGVMPLAGGPARQVTPPAATDDVSDAAR